MDLKYPPEFYDSPPTRLIPPEATVLHSSTGLTIHQNPRNKFAIVTLYYYADPNKFNGAWEAEAAAGISNEHWEKEYLMNYTALFGAKVFPEIYEHRDQIVVPPKTFDEPGLRMWGGFDYGARNPSSFHVYTYLDGIYYAIWKLYEPCRNITDFANRLRACPYWHRLEYIAADPSIFATRTHARDGNPTSVVKLFEEQGIYTFRAGITLESSFVAAIRQFWSDPANIRFKILETCPYMIQEFQQAIYSAQRPTTSINHAYDESIADQNNHALDDAKYFFNSQPNPSRRQDIKWPTMWKRFKN